MCGCSLLAQWLSGFRQFPLGGNTADPGTVFFAQEPRPIAEKTLQNAVTFGRDGPEVFEGGRVLVLGEIGQPGLDQPLPENFC